MTNLVDFVASRSDAEKLLPGGFQIFSGTRQLVRAVSSFDKLRISRADSSRQATVRTAIAEYAEKFQSKLSRIVDDARILEEVQSRIDLLKDRDRNWQTLFLMSAHQPNLFAYSGVMRKIILLWFIEQSLRSSQIQQEAKSEIVCFYGFADHDFVHNKWVRSAEIDSPIRKDGVLRYSIKIDQNQTYLPTNKIQKPGPELLEKWQAQTEVWISENLSLTKKYLRGKGGDTSGDGRGGGSLNDTRRAFEDFWSLVQKSQQVAENLAEFSSLLLAAVAQEKWKIPMLFANFSDCFKSFSDEYLWLVSNKETFASIVENEEAGMKSQGIDTGLASDIGELSPLWLKCDCGSKYRMEMRGDEVLGRCVRCGADYTIELEKLKRLIADKPERIEPRSIAMPIVFSKAVGMACYVGGIGSLGYLMHSSAISTALNVIFPPTPFWYSEDEFKSIQKLAELAELDRMQKAYLQERRDPTGDYLIIARALEERLADPVKASVAKRPAEVERDKQLLKRILSKKGSGTTSCMVDYAVNISLERSAEQWLQFLRNDGRLMTPVHMTCLFEAPPDLSESWTGPVPSMS